MSLGNFVNPWEGTGILGNKILTKRAIEENVLSKEKPKNDFQTTRLFPDGLVIRDDSDPNALDTFISALNNAWFPKGTWVVATQYIQAFGYFIVTANRQSNIPTDTQEHKFARYLKVELINNQSKKENGKYRQVQIRIKELNLGGFDSYLDATVSAQWLRFYEALGERPYDNNGYWLFHFLEEQRYGQLELKHLPFVIQRDEDGRYIDKEKNLSRFT